MKLRTAVPTLLATVLPATAAARTRTAADYMAAVEGAQTAAGPNDLTRVTPRWPG